MGKVFTREPILAKDPRLHLMTAKQPGGSTGRDIFSHGLVFNFARAESVLDHVADRHQADELPMADNREMARALIGHLFHRHIDTFVLTRGDHFSSHVR